jgi:hypothetical protein
MLTSTHHVFANGERRKEERWCIDNNLRAADMAAWSKTSNILGNQFQQQGNGFANSELVGLVFVCLFPAM